ncbi:hypothetical protein MSAN_01621800 [Mycena sanguinolenta]|uniref:F-box domain-containing protein n=1 Tax=Mycena sanguinolenta TaxID=230812 RepID=A0A8H6Y2H3_9AGAR|nr:hypothetical protein MSAN_01621800 [Mycena sanguinolenta]
MISIRPPFTPQFLQSKLQSGQRLSAEEIAIATEFISVAEHCISYVDASISRTGPGIELDELKQERANIIQQIARHKNAICTIRRIPPEIISKFLVLSVPQLDIDDFGQPPWHLGHICGDWREIALETPSLWSDIVVFRPREYPLEKLHALLDRSSNSPLKFLFWAASTTSQEEPRIRELLQIMVACAPRWISASIAVNPHDWGLLAPLRGRIPRLHYLRIDVSDFGGFHHPQYTVMAKEKSDPFEIAPALRDVTLEDLSTLPHALKLPFQQLTRIKVVESCTSIRAMLQTASNLQMASLDFTDDPLETGFPVPIRLQHLRRLYVSAQPFLHQLELPALEEIYLVNTDPAPFLSLIGRCPTIRLTRLSMAFCGSTNLIRILEACPSIQSLGLQLTNNEGNDVLSKLTVRRTGAILTSIGPNVHSISLGIDRAPIKYEQFVKMVESRWRVPRKGSPCCRLRSVELFVVDSGKLLSTSQQERIDTLKGEGLRVSVLQGTEAHYAIMDWRI